MLAGKGCVVAIYLPYYKQFVQLEELKVAGVLIYYGSPPPRRSDIRIRHFLQGRQFTFPSCVADFSPDLTVVSMGNHLEQTSFFRAYPRIPQPYVLLPQLAMQIYASFEEWQYAKNLFKNAHAVFCVSGENKSLIEADLGIDLRRAEILGNAFARISAPRPSPGPPWKLAVPARIDFYHKGQDLVLRVMRESKWRDREVEINLYGCDSRCQVEDYCKIHSIRNVTIFKHSPLVEIWSNNHALLLPSRYEGMSLSMLEAMWVGRPVFATDVGGVRELVTDGENGLIESPGSVTSVEKLLERAWESRDSWNKMGERAAARIREIFPIPVAEKFADVLFDMSDAIKGK